MARLTMCRKIRYRLQRPDVGLLSDRFLRVLRSAGEGTPERIPGLPDWAQAHGLDANYRTRSLSLTRRAMEHVSSGTLVEAVAASTDRETMLRILEAPEMAAPVIETATIDAARAAGIEGRDQLLTAQGGSWPVERVAKYLGLTRQAVDKRRKVNKLIGLAVGRHGYRYPSW